MNYILKNSLIILFSICFLKVNAQKSPNIIVFLADDVGWKDAGCYGNSLIKTYLPKYAKIVKEMAALLDNWVSETQDHSPLIRRRYDNVDWYSGIKFTDEQPPMFNEKAVTKKKPE